MRNVVLTVLVLFLFSKPAIAQDNWTEMGLYVFATDVSGDLEVGNFSTDVDVSFSDILENLDIGVLGLVEHRSGDWMFILDLAYLSLEADNKASNGMASVKIGTEAVQSIVEGFIGHRLYKKLEKNKTKYAIDVLAGARYVNIDLDTSANVSALGTGAKIALDSDIDFIDPVIGSRFRYNINKTWGISIYGDIGGFGIGSELTWQAICLVNYNIENDYRIYAGLRYLHFRYEDDTALGNLEWEANYSGPVIGFAKRF